MRVLAVAATVFVLLGAALLVEAVFDSAVGAWVALGVLAGYAILRLFGWLPGVDGGD